MNNLVAPAAPQAAVAPANPAPDTDPSGQDGAPEEQQEAPVLPPSLTKVPAIQGLLVGAPPAVSATIKSMEKSDLGKEIADNKDALLSAGFGFYRSMHGDLVVMFNRFHIHGDDLKAADKAGKLQVLAPPFEQVDHALVKNGGKHLLGAKIPGGFATARPPVAVQPGAQAAAGAPSSMDASPAAPASGGASAALQQRLQGARLSALAPGAPTSGPAPGAGRLLNSILKPVV